MGDLELILSPLQAAGQERSQYDITVDRQWRRRHWSDFFLPAWIARALTKMNAELVPAMRKGGFLTRDPRVKERKKPGLKRARKAPTYTKR